MKIGIDIDGVLTDVEKWQLDYASKFYYENYKKEIVNYKGYETNEIFAMDIECDNKFWKEYYVEYSENVDCRRLAAEVIRKLREENNEIYIITARGNHLKKDKVLFEQSCNMVLNWLKQNKIVYDKIIFSPEDKKDICMENKIDIMIEDKVDNINKIASIIPVICFHAGYNEKCSGENIYRVYSWYDVYSKISKLK